MKISLTSVRNPGVSYGQREWERAMQSLVVLKACALKLIFDADHNAEVARIPHPRYRMMFREIHMTRP
jgi:3-deoxy-D-manno-octulosonic acid (KDO) 8-phosphate synthase